MSANDLQAKCAPVMESILQSAMAETTKLFQAMIDELMLEVSGLKKENDDLKAKCSKFEHEQTGNKPCGKRHRAVQCDIIPFMLHEQCQPSMQNQHNHQEMFYPLQEHDYGICGMGRIVRHKSVLRQEEINSSYNCRDVSSAEAELPWASKWEAGSEKSPLKMSEVLQKLPDLGMYNKLQGGQSPEVRPSVNGQPSVKQVPHDAAYSKGEACAVDSSQCDVVDWTGPPPDSASPSVQPRKRHTSVTLQDAKLLVEAMSSSVEKDAFFAQEVVVEPACVGALQTTDRALAGLEILSPAFESPKAVSSLLNKGVTAAESSQEAVPSAATSTTVQPLQQRGPSSLEATMPTGGDTTVSKTITIIPRLAYSLERRNPADDSPTLVSAVAAKVDTTTINGKVQPNSAPDLPDGSQTNATVPVKTLFISSESLPAAELTTGGELLLRTTGQQTVVLTALSEPDTSGRAPNLPSQEVEVSWESPMASDMAPSASQTGDSTSKKSVNNNHSSKVQNEYSQSCFSFSRAAGLKLPAAFHLKPSAMVRLTRLPFLMSGKESVLISKLCSSKGWDDRSALKQDTGHGEKSAGEELLSVGCTHSPSPSSESPPVVEEPALTFNNTDASAQTASPANMNREEKEKCALWKTGQPIEEKISSKEQEKDSASCTETHRNKRKRFQKDQLRNNSKPHLQTRNEANHHAETPAVCHKEIQTEHQHSKIKMDMSEIDEPVASVKTNAECSTPTIKPGPAASKYKDPDNGISHSNQRTPIKKAQNTTLCTRESSSVRNVTSPRNTKPGLRHYGSNSRFRRTRLIQVMSQPESAESLSIIKRSESSLIKSQPKTGTAKPASVALPRCSSVQGRPEQDDEKKSNSSSSSTRMTTRGTSNRDGETQIKPTIKKNGFMQADASPKNELKVVNAKMLAKTKKVNIVKVKTSKRLSQNNAKTKRLDENRPGNGAVKKVRSSGVWIPPVIETTREESEAVSIKKETSSPRSPERCLVHPPSVSLHPIPVKAAPVVSPLQPLSLIGSRLLKNQCGECGQVLGSSAALESHVSLHTGQRPFSCRLCGKCFTDEKGLKRHGRVHRNGKIYVCKKCGKGFVYRFSLTKHLQMVHRRIKPFVCQICNKSFFTKLDVESHIRIHTGEKPFHCNLCERKFIRRVDLNVHLRWHNGEKRHWCPYCDKGFLDLNNLKRHKFIHTGEKPHPCPHCPKHFTQSAHLKKHVKNVHKVAGGPQICKRRKVVNKS